MGVCIAYANGQVKTGLFASIRVRVTRYAAADFFSNGVVASDRIERTIEDAGVVLDEGQQVLDAFAFRSIHVRWWRRWGPRRLTSSEQRLTVFLERTLLPCTALVMAGALQFRDPEAAEVIAAPVRLPASKGPVSWRVSYNLACYEAMALGLSRVSTAFDEAQTWYARHEAARSPRYHLKQALAGARGRSRAQLIQRAQSDPTLTSLRARDAAGFDRLIDRFRPPDVAGPPHRSKERAGAEEAEAER